MTERENPLSQIGIFVMIPFLLGLPPILGWFLGDWLDAKFGTSFLTYLLIILGMIAGFREVYRVIKRFGNEL